MSLRKQREKCLNCKTNEVWRAEKKYCSNACQMEYQHLTYIEQWKSGEVVGLQTIGTVSPYIKKYLRGKFSNRCCLCGWSEVNQKTGLVPLVADHIDGNWRNNTEDNLRLLCPNCDSLTPTFAGLNRGNSGRVRVLSKRAREARLLKT